MTSGRKASATRPLPNPARPRTRNAPAITTAASARSRLTPPASGRRRACTSRARGGIRHGEVRSVRQRLRQVLRGGGGGRAPRVRQLRVRDSPHGAGVCALRLQGGGPRRGGRKRVLLLRQLCADGGRARASRSRRLSV